MIICVLIHVITQRLLSESTLSELSELSACGAYCVLRQVSVSDLAREVSLELQ